ncbi:MAG: hypothetical protein ACKOUT_15665 [Novosphingobium sp.]
MPILAIVVVLLLIAVFSATKEGIEEERKRQAKYNPILWAIIIILGGSMLYGVITR